jgi:hypothetical protein
LIESNNETQLYSSSKATERKATLTNFEFTLGILIDILITKSLVEEQQYV